MSLRSASEILIDVRDGHPLISDGAVGSELIRCGVASDRVPFANLSHPELIMMLASQYLEAGCNLLTTNTFALCGGEHSVDAGVRGYQIVRRIIEESARSCGILFSIACDLPDEALQTLARLYELNPTLPAVVLVETCTQLQRAVEVAKAVKGVFPTSTVAATAHFDTDDAMFDGTVPERFAEVMVGNRAEIVGANCGVDPSNYVRITRRMKSATDAPLLVQPSGGLPVRNAQGRWSYPTKPNDFARLCVDLYAAGASIVGGCCGISPEHMAEVSVMCGRTF